MSPNCVVRGLGGSSRGEEVGVHCGTSGGQWSVGWDIGQVGGMGQVVGEEGCGTSLGLRSPTLPRSQASGAESTPG